MALFFLGLAIGLALGLNYRLVTDRLATLFAAPDPEPASELSAGPAVPVLETPKETRETPAKEASKTPAEEPADEPKAKPRAEAEPAPAGPVSIIFASREPSWVDVPFVKKPKVEFLLESADPRHPRQSLTLALGERGALSGEAGARYEARASLVGLSRTVWLFNVGGRFDARAVVELGSEPVRVLYETPATLREAGRLSVNVVEEPASAGSPGPA